MELEDIYQNINWKALIIGQAIFAFIVVLGYRNQILEILSIFSSIGLLYVGYASQNRIQGTLLGSIGTIPLGLGTAFFGLLGENLGTNIELFIIISFLAIGALCGFTGAYFNERRKIAIEEKIKRDSIGKGKKKKNKNANNKD